MELIPVLRGMKPQKKTAAKPAVKKSLPKKTQTKK